MVKNKFKIRAKVWHYPGMTGWHFVSLPIKQSAEIKKVFAAMRRRWGSLPVVVITGKTSWKTSIFPDKQSGGYLLPLKADVRKKEQIFSEDIITFSLSIQ